MLNNMKAFLEYVLKNLVDSPESVSVQQVLHSGRTTLEVRVKPSDVGKVVGKQGQTIAAIRSVVNAAASRYGGKVQVDIIEEAPSGNPLGGHGPARGDQNSEDPEA